MSKEKKILNLSSGQRYVNRVGAVMIIDGYWLPRRGTLSLGYIYEAHTPKDLFGSSQYLVTAESLTECGYVLDGQEETEEN